MEIFRICFQNIRKWTTNSRIMMCFMLAFLLVISYTGGLRIVANYLGEDMNPWIYPFLMTYRYIKIFFMIIFVFILCDAPFIDSNQISVILRTSRVKWCLGQILYIISSAFTYSVFLFLSSIIVNIRYIKWGTSWGTVIGKAGSSGIMNTLGVNYSTVNISNTIIRYYTPIQAIILTFIIQFLSMVMIGLIIYFFNSITKIKILGVVIAAFWILFTAIADNNAKMIWISPITWNSINNIDVAGATAYPSYSFVFSMYGITIIVLMILSIMASRKQEIIVGKK